MKADYETKWVADWVAARFVSALYKRADALLDADFRPLPEALDEELDRAENALQAIYLALNDAKERTPEEEQLRRLVIKATILVEQGLELHYDMQQKGIVAS